jgi:hypothetical protein
MRQNAEDREKEGEGKKGVPVVVVDEVTKSRGIDDSQTQPNPVLFDI